MQSSQEAGAPPAGHFDVLEHGFELLQASEVNSSFVSRDLTTTTRACKWRASWVLLVVVGILQAEPIVRYIT